jgi:hypothetical protein
MFKVLFRHASTWFTTSYMYVTDTVYTNALAHIATIIRPSCQDETSLRVKFKIICYEKYKMPYTHACAHEHNLNMGTVRGVCPTVDLSVL